MSKTCVLYGCGGAGINVTAHYLGAAIDDRFTTFLPVALDTSRSNLTENKFPEDKTYLIPNMDGAGGYRALAAAVKPHIEPMITNHPPGDLNIVVFSGGGGSGNVIGTLVASHLISKGHDVVVIVLQCGHNKVHLTNTQKALESLKGVAVSNNINIAILPVSLDSESKQNQCAWSHIGSLSLLWSGNVRRLDSQDLHHFLHHEVHTGVKGVLTNLFITTNPSEVLEYEQPLSIASIYRDSNMDRVQPTCIYHTHGFNDLEHNAFDQIHYCLSEVELADYVKSVNEGLSKFEEKVKSVAKADIGISTTGADDSGMVFN